MLLDIERKKCAKGEIKASSRVTVFLMVGFCIFRKDRFTCENKKKLIDQEITRSLEQSLLGFKVWSTRSNEIEF